MECAWTRFLRDKQGWWAKLMGKDLKFYSLLGWSMPSQKPQARSTPATIRNQSSWWSLKVKSYMHWWRENWGDHQSLPFRATLPSSPSSFPQVGGWWIWCLQLHKIRKREQQHSGIPGLSSPQVTVAEASNLKGKCNKLPNRNPSSFPSHLPISPS